MVRGPGFRDRWGYSESIRNRGKVKKTSEIIRWLESLEVSEGRLAGSRLALAPWQRRFIRAAWRPGVRTAALSVGRGNGKSTFVGALAACACFGPLAERRGSVIVVSSSFRQSLIVFRHCLAFLRPWIAVGGTGANGAWRVVEGQHTAMISYRPTGATVEVGSSDYRRIHGASFGLALMDEPAQWPANTRDRLLAAVRTSLGKRENSKLIALGTRPAGGDHFFARWLDGAADYRQEHRAREKDNPHRKSTWLRANPSLPFMPDLEEAIRNESRSAKASGQLSEFRALRLNQGVQEVEGAEMLIDLAAWRDCEELGEAEAEGPSVWGVDLGGGGSLTAGACYWPRTGRLAAMAMCGDIPDLQQRGRQDGVDRLYVDLASTGDLKVWPGRVPAPEALLREALDRWGPPAAIVADRYKEREFRDALDRAGVPARGKWGRVPVTFRGMGWKDGAEDVRRFRRAVSDKKIRPGESMLLRAALVEAVTISDPAGNLKLARGSAGGRRSRARDDAIAAAILAVADGERRGPGRNREIRYEVWNPGDPL